MKKSMCFCILGCALTLLASCSGTSKTSLTYSNKNVLSEDVINSNISEVTSMELDVHETVLHYPTPDEITSSKIYDETYAQNGLLILKNNYNKVGFYSTFHQSWILKPQFVPAWLDYNVYTVDQIGYLLYFSYEDNYFLYDAFGNLFLNSKTERLNSFTTTPRNGKIYLTIFTNTSTKYYQYSNDGVATKISRIPYMEDDYMPPEVNYDGPSLNDLFTEGWLDLTIYGLEGYKLAFANNNYVTIFHNNEYVNDFYLEHDAELLGIVKGSLLYQRRNVIPNDSMLYDFYDGVKYELNHVFVNLKNGNKTYEKFDKVFSDFSPLKDKDNNVAYYMATYQNITDSLILDENQTFVVDRNFVFYNDITHLEFESLQRLDENTIYNYSTKILYDNELNVITNLRYMDPIYYAAQKLFMGRVNGLYGLVNLSGEVVAEFKYTTIYIDYLFENSLIGFKNNDAYRIILGSGDIFVGNDWSLLDHNLFQATATDGALVYFTSSKNITRVPSSSAFSVSLTKSTLLNYSTYVLRYTRLGTVYYNLLVWDGFTLNTITNTGVESTVTTLSGATENDAQILNDGETPVHIIRDDYTYFSFMPEDNGYYSFYLPSYVSFSSVKGLNSSGSIVVSTYAGNTSVSYSTTKEEYSRKITVLATGVEEIILKVINSASVSNYIQLQNLYVEKESGENSSYPLYFDANSQTAILKPSIFATSNVYNFYINFVANKTAYYEFALEGSNTISNLYYGSIAKGTKLLGLSKGTTSLIRVNTFSKVTGATKLKFTTDTNVNLDGYSSNKPFTAEYGSNSYDFYYNGLLETAYVKFTSPHGGKYTFASSTNSSSIKLQFYNKNGSSLTSTSSTSYTYSMSEGYYLLISIRISTSTTGFTYGQSIYFDLNISSTEGLSYENPKEFYTYESLTLNSSSSNYFVYKNTGSSKNLIYNCEVPDSYVSVKGFLDSTSNTKVNISNSRTFEVAQNDSLFIIVTNSSTSSKTYKHYFTNTTDYTGTALVLNSEVTYTFSSNSDKARYTFTNTNEESKTYYLNVESSYGVYYSYFFNGYLEDGYMGEINNNSISITLPASTTVYITLQTKYSYGSITANVSMLEEPKIRYTINLNYSGYSWTEYSTGVYRSTNKGVTSSSSSMRLDFYYSGTLSFEYQCYAESSCDVLRIYKNTSLLKTSSSSSTWYTYTITVSAGDYVIFTYSKDGSVNSNYDYASIRSFSFN